jgi:predicted nuclease with TOPRIM domain
MALTVEQYEGYKSKLAGVQKEITTLEAKQAQIEEHLKLTYGMTPEQAKEELARLEVELPKMEADFEKHYEEFMTKYGEQVQ